MPLRAGVRIEKRFMGCKTCDELLAVYRRAVTLRNTTVRDSTTLHGDELRLRLKKRNGKAGVPRCRQCPDSAMVQATGSGPLLYLKLRRGRPLAFEAMKRVETVPLRDDRLDALAFAPQFLPQPANIHI